MNDVDRELLELEVSLCANPHGSGCSLYVFNTMILHFTQQKVSEF